LTRINVFSMMLRMLRAAGFPLVFLALFSIAGGHWAALQTVAWTGMIIEYSKDSSLGAALSKTFSGQAPCKLCHSIEAGKQKERRLPATVKADKKFEKFLARSPVTIPIPSVRDYLYPPFCHMSPAMRPMAPPGPVPRQAVSTIA